MYRNRVLSRVREKGRAGLVEIMEPVLGIHRFSLGNHRRTLILKKIKNILVLKAFFRG